MCHLWIQLSNLNHNLREKSVGTRETDMILNDKLITAETQRKKISVYDVYGKTSRLFIEKNQEHIC